MRRPGWSDYFMQFAVVAASRATCPRAHVGAVIVVDNRIIATGYNGSAPGEEHCDSHVWIDKLHDAVPKGVVGCLMEDGHCQRTLHAEVNAIAQCARSGVSCEGGHLYIYFEPGEGSTTSYSKPTPGCRECLKVIKAAGIALVTCRIGDQVQTFHMKKGTAHEGLTVGFTFDSPQVGYGSDA